MRSSSSERTSIGLRRIPTISLLWVLFFHWSLINFLLYRMISFLMMLPQMSTRKHSLHFSQSSTGCKLLGWSILSISQFYISRVLKQHFHSSRIVSFDCNMQNWLRIVIHDIRICLSLKQVPHDVITRLFDCSNQGWHAITAVVHVCSRFNEHENDSCMSVIVLHVVANSTNQRCPTFLKSRSNTVATIRICISMQQKVHEFGVAHSGSCQKRSAYGRFRLCFSTSLQ